MENYCELEQMRQEMAELRARLDRQTIISEEHIRRSMCDKVHRIKVQTTLLAVLGVAGAAYCLWALHWFMGLSLARSRSSRCCFFWAPSSSPSGRPGEYGRKT